MSNKHLRQQFGHKAPAWHGWRKAGRESHRGEWVWNGKTLGALKASSLSAVPLRLKFGGKQARQHWPWGLTKLVICSENVCLFPGELHNCLFGRTFAFFRRIFSQRIPSFSN